MSAHPPRGRFRARRAAEAVEFALVTPVLLLVVLGIIEFGWYYFEQALCTDAVVTAMRVGAMQVPTLDEEGTGRCAACVGVVPVRAVPALGRLGIDATADELTPELVDVGGACTLVLDARVDHRSLLGFLAVPEHYVFHASAVVPAATGCALSG